MTQTVRSCPTNGHSVSNDNKINRFEDSESKMNKCLSNTTSLSRIISLSLSVRVWVGGNCPKGVAVIVGLRGGRGWII